MRELRRVLLDSKFILALVVLIAFNVAALYLEQTRANQCSNLLIYGRAYQQLMSEIKSDDLTRIQRQLEEQQKKYEDNLASMDKSVTQSDALATSGTDAVAPLHYSEDDYGAVVEEKQIVDRLLKQVQDLRGYPAYLLQIQQEKERITKFSFLQSGNGFGLKNVEKTARDFQPLFDTKVQFGADWAVKTFTQYRLPDYLSLIIIVLVCFRLNEEQRKGLKGLFSSLPRGRRWLASNRALLLLLLSVAITVFFYIGTLITCFVLFGGTQDLGRPLQSITLFQTSTLQISIREYLILFCVLKVFATFLIALAIWNIFRIFNEIKFSMLLLILTFGVEYLAYSSIPVQSYLNPLKYINLFSFVDINPLFFGYFNLNVFGYPVNVRLIIFALLLPCILFLLLLSLRERYVKRHKLQNRLRWLRRLTARMITGLHLFGFELYKLLILQKGVLVFAALVIVVVNIQFLSYIPQDAVERQTEVYLRQLEGPITRTTISKIDHLRAEISAQEASFAEIDARYHNGQISFAEYYKKASVHDDILIRDAALQTVQNKVTKLQRLKRETSESPWLLPEYSFKSIYGYLSSLEQDHESFARQQGLSILSLFALCLLFAGSYAFEHQSGTISLLRTTPRGRRYLRVNKLFVSILSACFVWLCVNGMEVFRLYQNIAWSSLQAPAYSLSMFMFAPQHLSTTGYLSIIYLLRLVNLWCVACIIMLISSKCKSVGQATLVSSLVIVVPSLMYIVFGIGAFQYLALSLPFSVMNTLIRANGVLWGSIKTTLVLLCLAITSLLAIGYRRQGTFSHLRERFLPHKNNSQHSVSTHKKSLC